MNRMFKRSNRSTQIDRNENTNAAKTESTTTTEENQSVNENENCSAQPTTIFVTTINTDSSITEEKKSITPSTPLIDELVPMERKQQYTFIMLISNQGQEVLRSKHSFSIIRADD